MKRILFVCLGNICRSPAAEGVMQKLLERDQLTELIQLDSAGTSAHHEGEPADHRMRSVAKSRGYNLTSLARPFHESDFKNFDYILTMDNQNYQDVIDDDPHARYRDKVKPMVGYCKLHKIPGVPDPYYGGEQGFHQVLDILEDACENLLLQLKAELGMKNQ